MSAVRVRPRQPIGDNMQSEIKSKRPRYIFEIPEQLRNEFEATCALQGTKRVDVMIKFIKAYVAGHKAALEIIREKHLMIKDGV